MDQILFYNGECGICTRSVRFLLKCDKQQRIRFAPLQGTTAQSLLSKGLREDLSTAVYRRCEGEVYLRSSAVLEALIDTNSSLRHLAVVGLWLPSNFRNACYDWIARNRKGILAKEVCKLPTSSEVAQMLP